VSEVIRVAGGGGGGESLSAADRGGVGIRLPGRDQNAVLFSAALIVACARLVRHHVRRPDAPGGEVAGESLGPARHVRQRLGMVLGLLCAVWDRSGARSGRTGGGNIPGVSRRRVE